MNDEPIDQPGTPGQPPPPPTEPTPAEQGAALPSNQNSAFLVIGFVFIVIAITNFTQESSRGVAFAFLPIGITFLILGLPKQKKGRAPKS